MQSDLHKSMVSFYLCHLPYYSYTPYVVACVTYVPCCSYTLYVVICVTYHDRFYDELVVLQVVRELKVNIEESHNEWLKVKWKEIINIASLKVLSELNLEQVMWLSKNMCIANSLSLSSSSSLLLFD